MTVSFLNLRQQYREIKSEIDAAVSEVLSTAGFVGGPQVAAFEAEFAGFQQAQHCVGVGNGTDAIEIALEALGLPAGSEVLVPANSFIATSEAVTRAGHRVVFCDIDPTTYLLSIDDAEARITERTAAVVAVHLYGRPADITAISAMAERHGLVVLEDAAQAHGAEHRGRRVGAQGHVGTFSFYPGKNLGAYGDGGAIVTDNEALASRCRMIANHGRTEKYVHEFEGRNSRLDALQAAVLRVKLRHLDEWVDRRNRVAAVYRDGLKDLDGLVLPDPLDPRDRHAFHLFVVRTPQVEELARHLDRAGVQTARHYPLALPKQPAYAHLADAETPHASTTDSRLLSLPIGEHLTGADTDHVVEAVRSFFDGRPTATRI